jgi:hypothetical protein
LGAGERHEAIARDRVLPVGADDELIDRPERIQSVGHRQRAGQRATPIAAREAANGAHCPICRRLIESIDDDQQRVGHTAKEAEPAATRRPRNRQAEQRFELPRRVRVVCGDGRGRDGHAVVI